MSFNVLLSCSIDYKAKKKWKWFEGCAVSEITGDETAVDFQSLEDFSSSEPELLSGSQD